MSHVNSSFTVHRLLASKIIVVIRNCPHFRYVMDMGSHTYLKEEMLVSIFISNVELSESATENVHMKWCILSVQMTARMVILQTNSWICKKYSGRTLLIEKKKWHSYWISRDILASVVRNLKGDTKRFHVKCCILISPYDCKNGNTYLQSNSWICTNILERFCWLSKVGNQSHSWISRNILTRIGHNWNIQK